MRMTLISALTLASIFGGVLWPKLASGQQGNASSAVNHESPFACNRMALTPEQRKRHFDELGPALRSLRTGVHELTDGFEFEYPSDPHTYQLLAEWTAGERLCCPFFDIDLRSERENGPLKLRLTGREGVKRFIEADFAKWFAR